MNLSRFIGMTLLCAALANAGVASAGQYATFTFSPLTSGNSVLNTVGNQISVSILEGGYSYNPLSLGSSTGQTLAVTSGQVAFLYKNNVGNASNVAEIYVQDGWLGGISSITNSGTTFSTSNNLAPGNMPGGNGLNPKFVATQLLSTDSDQQGGGSSGINSSSEWVAVFYTLTSGGSYSSVVSALIDGSTNPSKYWNTDGSEKTLASGEKGLRIGLHVRSIAGWSGSDASGELGSMSYLVNPDSINPPLNVVPEPSTLAMGIFALGAMGLVGYRRRKMA